MTPFLQLALALAIIILAVKIPGFLFVVPVIEAYGLGRHRRDRSKE